MILLIILAYLTALLSLAVLLTPNAILKRLVPAPIANNKLKVALPLFIISFIGVQVDNIFFYAEAGHSYFVQYKTGTQVVIIDKPGPRLKLYGEVMDFKNVNTVKYTTEVAQKVSSDTKNTKISAVVAPVQIRFNDAVNADVSFTVRYRLPRTEEAFEKMAKEFRSQANLIRAIQVPVGREVARNAGRMFSAQEYISGKGGDFENFIDDQMRRGIILLDADEERVGVKEIVVDSTQRTIKDKRSIKYTVKPRVNENGEYIRKFHGLNEYGIEVAQVTVENVEPEQKFKDMLAKQRDAAAQASVEKQTTQKAEYKKQRVIAEGETEKAQIRISKEKEQIDILINAETEKKKAQLELEKNQIALKSAKLEAKRTKELADAEAYKKAKIYKADGALEKKLKAYVMVNQNYAEAIATTKAKLVPEIQIGTDGSKGGSGDATALIKMLTAKTAKDLSLEITK